MSDLDDLKNDAAIENWLRRGGQRAESPDEREEREQREADHAEAIEMDEDREYADDYILGFSQNDWDEETATGKLDDEDSLP
jgi:hypothetical protein